MRNDFWYHAFILGITFLVTEFFFENMKRVYRSTNVHRKLEPHYLAEKEYKKKMEELEALEEDDEDDEDDDDDDDEDED